MKLPPHVAPDVPLGLLEARIAEALGWSLRDVRSMSLHSLRELVRPVSAKLAEAAHGEDANGSSDYPKKLIISYTYVSIHAYM